MLHFDSVCARETNDFSVNRPHILPLYLTSGFVFDDIDQGIRIFSREEPGHVYGRFGNPTIDAVAAKIAQLETHGTDIEAAALFCSSGMAAIHTLVTALLMQGDIILTQGNLYGGTTELFTRVLSRGGIGTLMTDFSDLSEVRRMLEAHPGIKLIYFESPANPAMQCVDIAAVCALAAGKGVRVAVDNTVATPYLQQPFHLGADFVIHSTTKYLNGHGNSIAGVIVGRDTELMRSAIWETMKLTGTNASPMEAWLVHQGLKTLSLRMERHCENAQHLAEALEQHRNVVRVNYTGLPSHPDHVLATRQMRSHGGILSFELSGGLDAGIAAMRQIRFCTLSPTLGDVDTLILHPASMSHLNVPREIRERNGITDGLIRVSVGIEHYGDILEDLLTAIDR